MGGFDWGAIWYAAPYMAKGALVTIEISACAMVLATVIGLIMGLISASDLTVLKVVVRVYVYFIRGTPALVLSTKASLKACSRLPRIMFCESFACSPIPAPPQ